MQQANIIQFQWPELSDDGRRELFEPRPPKLHPVDYSWNQGVMQPARYYIVQKKKKKEKK